MAIFCCLLTILDNCKEFLPSNLYVVTNAWVVLSWILLQSIASKNIFAKNGVKDILQMSHGLDSQYNHQRINAEEVHI